MLVDFHTKMSIERLKIMQNVLKKSGVKHMFKKCSVLIWSQLAYLMFYIFVIFSFTLYIFSP